MFYDKYKQLCKARGISPSAAAAEIGLNKSSVTFWKKSGSVPRSTILKLIADYFGVSMNYLMDEDEDENETKDLLTNEEAYLLETFRMLPETSKQWVMQSLEMAKTSAFGKNNSDSSLESV